MAIAERLAPFKVKKFIYTDVAPRPDLAKIINAEYGKDQIHFSCQHFILLQLVHKGYNVNKVDDGDLVS